METFRVTLNEDWTFMNRADGGEFKRGHVFDPAPESVIIALRDFENQTGKAIATFEAKPASASAPARPARPVEG